MGNSTDGHLAAQPPRQHVIKTYEWYIYAIGPSGPVGGIGTAPRV